MTQLDQFESVFKAAAKPVFRYRQPAWNRVLVVTDQDQAASEQLVQRLQSFLGGVLPQAAWQVLSGAELKSVGALLQAVQSQSLDLVCTYRNLHTQAWRWPYSLGDYVDVLVQHTDVPVLLVPHPLEAPEVPLPTNTDRVMAVTDHLTGDAWLVSVAASLTAPQGILYLTHIEDEETFQRYMAVIEKIPEIDTDMAREAIAHQLLKEPADYIHSCRQGLQEAGRPLQVESIVQMGRHLEQYRSLIRQHAADLLVFPASREGMAAMHGRAYALAVELRRVPLLLL